MHDKVFSITKVASQLHVSRQTIYNKIDEFQSELKPFIIIKNNVKYLKIEAINIIKESINPPKLNKEKESTNQLNINGDTIEFLKNELLKKDKIYSDYISDLKQNTENLKQRIEHLEKESIQKNKLLENMQVLLKDQKLLIGGNPNRRWWKFWKS